MLRLIRQEIFIVYNIYLLINNYLLNKVNNYYIQKIILKIEREKSFQKAKQLLDEHITDLISNSKFKSVNITIDVDPV